MKKNVAGQVVLGQLNALVGNAPVTTGATTVYVTGNAGTQAAGSVGAGACTHKGNGLWSYAPAQAETNYDNVVFTFTNASAITNSVQIYPLAATVDANLIQIDGLTTSDGAAILNLTQLNVINASGDAIVATGGDYGMRASGGLGGIRAEGVVSGAPGILVSGNEHAGVYAQGSYFPGFLAECVIGNDDGIRASGSGTGSGIRAIGGDTGHGMLLQGGATSGDGLQAYAPGYPGSGIAGVAEGGSGISALSTGAAMRLTSTSDSGLVLEGGGTGAGLIATGGSSGTGIDIYGQGSGSGISSTGGDTGSGMYLQGGAISGDGLKINAPSGGGYGLEVSALGVPAMVVRSDGDNGEGLYIEGGTNGSAVRFVTHGDASGIDISGSGNGSGISATGGYTGHGMLLQGGATSGDGLHVEPAGTTPLTVTVVNGVITAVTGA